VCMLEDRVKKSMKTDTKALKVGPNLAWTAVSVILAVVVAICLAPDNPPHNHKIDNSEVLKQEYQSF